MTKNDKKRPPKRSIKLFAVIAALPILSNEPEDHYDKRMEFFRLYNYWIFILLMMIGFYIVIAKPNLVKKVIGLSVFQTAIFLFFLSLGKD